MKKKVLAAMLATALAATMFAGCGSSSSDTAETEEAVSTGEETAAEAEEADATSEEAEETDAEETDTVESVYKVGICKYVDDSSLDQILENIEEQLQAIADENGCTIEIDAQSGQADSAVIEQIIQNFIADDVDVMVGIATPVATMMQADTSDMEDPIPVIFSAVTDPEGAELVASNDAPGANITGTSDALNTESVMDMIFAVNPEADTIGLLYDLGQDSSEKAIAEAKAYLDDAGVTYIEKTGTTNDEVIQAVDSLVASEVDAVFTPTDNTIMTAELSIYEALAEAGIPHYTGADSFAGDGAFLGYGVSYAELGVETANMVGDVLLNGADPASTAVYTFDNEIATVNTDICEQLGYNYDDIVTAITPYCSEIREITTGGELQ